MVKATGILVLALLSSAVLAETTAGFSADSLRARMKQSEADKISASERLKASRSDPNRLTLLKGEDIYFKLPDGRLVPGMLLDNGKISPALMTDHGQLIPACVTDNNRLIPGRWDSSDEAIHCVLKQNERFAVLDHGIQQKMEGQPDTTPHASKYASAPPQRADQSTASTPAANKYGSSSEKHENHTDQASPRPNSSKIGNRPPPKPASTSPYIYDPPSTNSGGDKMVGGVLERDTKKFGIPVGTWIKAKLMRSASTAERGLIEFELKETVFGRYQDLPENTILFANKYINEAEEKMEATTVLARLPDGQEIKIEATVHALNQTAGLSGTLVRDREGEIVSASSNAVASAINNTVPVLESSAGSAVAGFAGDMINTESKYLPDKPKPIIRVASQECLLKITKTF